MATHESAAVHAHAAPTGWIRRYIFSLDHKVIGIQYWCLALFSVFLGMALSLLMRMHLAWPNLKIPFTEGGQITPEQYLALLTMHGSIMVFMVLTTAPQSGFGNYILPIQIGAADMAFPVLNMLSFWTTFISLCVMGAAFFVPGGAPISGWTGYPPLSALGEIAGPGQGAGQTLWVVGIAIFCAASLMGALNFITTVIDLRAKGMKLMRMPLTCWAWFVTAILGLLAFGVLLAACILLLLDRTAGTSFFVPGGLVVTDKIINHKGGSPLLWQHLFWFFGHPEVYIAILPGMGVASHVLSTFSRKPVFGYRAMVYALCGIGFLGFCVWGHHMFVSGMSPYSAFAFSLLTMSIGVPSAIKTFNWLGTLWGGKIQFWFTFIGVYAIFMPMHWLGMLGHPRRYSSTEVMTLSNAEYVSIHNFISIAAMITITAQLLFLFNFFWSLKKGKKAGVNPWNATTLEWTVPSPPPHDNFAGHLPTVNHGPYEFSVPGAPKDFILQSEAEAPAKKRG